MARKVLGVILHLFFQIPPDSSDKLSFGVVEWESPREKMICDLQIVNAPQDDFIPYHHTVRTPSALSTPSVLPKSWLEVVLVWQFRIADRRGNTSRDGITFIIG
jgi:hypothetical protein